jgi:hypothetical protein
VGGAGNGRVGGKLRGQVSGGAGEEGWGESWGGVVGQRGWGGVVVVKCPWPWQYEGMPSDWKHIAIRLDSTWNSGAKLI